MQTINGIQRLLGDFSNLWPTVWIKHDELVNLNKILDGDKDLNSPKKLSSEVERELVLVEEKLLIGVGQFCILSIMF